MLGESYTDVGRVCVVVKQSGHSRVKTKAHGGAVLLRHQSVCVCVAWSLCHMMKIEDVTAARLPGYLTQVFIPGRFLRTEMSVM